MRIALLIWLLSACVGSGTSTVPSTNTDPVIQAEVILQQAQILDYTAPMTPRRQALRDRAADLFLAACEHGTSPVPCVWTISLSVDTPSFPERDRASRARQRVVAATTILLPQCLSGKQDACLVFGTTSALHTDFFADPKDACVKGLGSACIAMIDKEPVTRAALEERACAFGVASACRTRMRADAGQHNLWKERTHSAEQAACSRGFISDCVNVDLARYRTLASERCSRGHLEDCMAWTGDAANDKARGTRACAATGRGCLDLAARDPEHARNFLEHACQFRDPRACIELVRGYRTRRFTEPVHDRLVTLTNFICSEPGFEVGACAAAQR